MFFGTKGVRLINDAISVFTKVEKKLEAGISHVKDIIEENLHQVIIEKNKFVEFEKNKLEHNQFLNTHINKAENVLTKIRSLFN